MSGIKEKAAIGLGIGLGLSALTSAYYWYQAKVRNAFPKAWRRVGTVSQLSFTPIKSCELIYLNEADCKMTGIQSGNLRDHMFMLIDDNSTVVTIRTYPQMLKIKQSRMNDGLKVSAPGMDPLEIKYTEFGQDDRTVKASIFGVDTFVVECGSRYDRWFSQFLQNREKGLRLVYYPYSTPTRVMKKQWKNGVFTNYDTGSLQDISSYMLMNEKSVEDLNTRLKRPMDPMQFRPNFLIKTTGPAYDEDKWEWIRIGNEAVFRTVGPCYRCILPNVNMKTAERDRDMDPLKTLKTYRLDGNSQSPVMGLQLGIRTTGVVKLGDEVFVNA